LQRLLISPKLTITSIWFALINYLLINYFSTSKKLTIVVDRTQWRSVNLLMVSLVWNSRAIPLIWQFLSNKGNSNLLQQQVACVTLACYECIPVLRRA
jgi:hypothetical protein